MRVYLLYTYVQSDQVRTWHVPLQTNRKLDSESITQSELTRTPLLEAAHLEKDSGVNVLHAYTSLYTVLSKYSHCYCYCWVRALTNSNSLKLL